MDTSMDLSACLDPKEARRTFDTRHRISLGVVHNRLNEKTKTVTFLQRMSDCSWAPSTYDVTYPAVVNAAGELFCARSMGPAVEYVSILTSEAGSMVHEHRVYKGPFVTIAITNATDDPNRFCIGTLPVRHQYQTLHALGCLSYWWIVQVRPYKCATPRAVQSRQFLLAEKCYNDVTIVLKDETRQPFDGRALAEASSVFKTMIYASQMEESKTRTIHLMEHDPDVVRLILDYMRTGETDKNMDDTTWTQVALFAHQFEMVRLMRHCDDEIAIRMNMHNMSCFLSLSKCESYDKIMKRIYHHLEYNCKDIIRTMVSAYPDQLAAVLSSVSKEAVSMSNRKRNRSSSPRPIATSRSPKRPSRSTNRKCSRSISRSISPRLNATNRERLPSRSQSPSPFTAMTGKGTF